MEVLKDDCGPEKTFPDEHFISCLCCIPRAWTLFVNDQWTRVFESHEEGLRLIKEFQKQKVINFCETISFMETIAGWLDEALWDDSFDHLIIVAPASLLSRVNKKLSAPVLARIIAEVDWPLTVKDYAACGLKKLQTGLPSIRE